MAHALLLYDPEFMFVADDDTYVNLKLMIPGGILFNMINNEFRNSPLVMGQLNGGNKITKQGFFFGGAGYLMGRAVIHRLLAHTLPGPVGPDHLRDQKHVNHLGVMEEAYPMHEKVA